MSYFRFVSRFNRINTWKAWAVCLVTLGLMVLWGYVFPNAAPYSLFFSGIVPGSLLLFFLGALAVAAIRTKQNVYAWLDQNPSVKTAAVVFILLFMGYTFWSDPNEMHQFWDDHKWKYIVLLMMPALLFIVHKLKRFKKKN